MKKISVFPLFPLGGYGAVDILRTIESGMSFHVREIQPTPNPNAAKFVLDRPISDQPISFFSAKAADGNAIAEALFAIPGVCSVLLLDDFVTVNKRPEANWRDVKSRVKRVLEKK